MSSAVSHEEKKMFVEWTFVGFWVLVFAIGWLVASRTSRHTNKEYRAFVPIAGAVTVFVIVGSIVLGGVFYPH